MSLRAFMTKGWEFTIKIPRRSILINVCCGICGKEDTVHVNTEWMQYQRLIFKCRACDKDLGIAEFDTKE